MKLDLSRLIPKNEDRGKLYKYFTGATAFNTYILQDENQQVMPKFIDTHPMGSLTATQLKQLQSAPKDKFGVTHHDILFNKEENRVYCVLNAPNKEAVASHHKHAGIECEWIHEVESTK